jgi:hypothetical protein
MTVSGIFPYPDSATAEKPFHMGVIPYDIIPHEELYCMSSGGTELGHTHILNVADLICNSFTLHEELYVPITCATLVHLDLNLGVIPN